MSDLGPTVGFLAALLLLADGCRRAGLFDALGAVDGRRRHGGEPRRLLAMVFVVAGGTTAVLSLDATIVLLTPDRVRHRGAAANQPAPARLRLLAPGQLARRCCCPFEPDQPARVSRAAACRSRGSAA